MKKDFSLIGFSIIGLFLGGYKTLYQTGFHFYVGLFFIVLSLVLLIIFLISLRKIKKN